MTSSLHVHSLEFSDTRHSLYYLQIFTYAAVNFCLKAHSSFEYLGLLHKLHNPVQITPLSQKGATFSIALSILTIIIRWGYLTNQAKGLHYVIFISVHLTFKKCAKMGIIFFLLKYVRSLEICISVLEIYRKAECDWTCPLSLFWKVKLRRDRELISTQQLQNFV